MARDQLVTAVFRDARDAEQALDFLKSSGHPRDSINLLTSEQRAIAPSHPRVSRGSWALQGMGVGGLLGLVIGGLTGAWMAIGTSVAVPGINFIIPGPVPAGLAVGGAGTLVGQFFGLIVGALFPARSAGEVVYQQALTRGGTVVSVQPNSADEAARIKERFRQLHADEVSAD